MRAISAFTVALLSSTTLFITPSKADASLEELKARLERAQKENLILKTEKVEKENLTIKAEALEAENAAMRNEGKATKAAASIPQKFEPSTPQPRIVAKQSQDNESARTREHSATLKAVDKAIAAIPKNDERRELVAVSKAAFDPTPVRRWEGIYFGINAGYSGNLIDLNTSTFLPATNQSQAALSTSSIGVGGPVAGGQIGYNYQFSNNLVVGAESDLDYADINNFNGSKRGANAGVFAFGNSQFGTTSSNYNRLGVNWLGSTRIRLAYAIGNFLPYVSGGFAYGQITSSLLSTNSFGINNDCGIGCNGNFLLGSVTSGNSAVTQLGWALGGGAEYKVADAWSIKGEYLYTSLGGITRNDTTIGTGGVVAFSQTSSGYINLHQVRMGLNYHTDWLASKPAVVAKY